MSRGNPYKHIMENAFIPFINTISAGKNLSDEKLECMQFGICEYRLEKVKDVPFFHY